MGGAGNAIEQHKIMKNLDTSNTQLLKQVISILIMTINKLILFSETAVLISQNPYLKQKWDELYSAIKTHLNKYDIS